RPAFRRSESAARRTGPIAVLREWRRQFDPVRNQSLLRQKGGPYVSCITYSSCGKKYSDANIYNQIALHVLYIGESYEYNDTAAGNTRYAWRNTQLYKGIRNIGRNPAVSKR